MAARYSHYLLPARGGRFPSRVLCLSVRGATTVEWGLLPAERSTLFDWSAVLLERHDGAYEHVWQSASCDPDQFWALLRPLLSIRGTTWVVSPHACRAWALLGLWERLEAGTVTLRRPAANLRARTVSAGRASREGALVDTNPPSLLRCWIPGVPGTLVWVDPKNWGAGCSDGTDATGHVAQRTARLVQSWCATLRALSLGSLQATAGSQSLHGWRAGYYTPGVWAHVHPGALALEANGYHGGRAEALRIGHVEGRAWYLDIRSAYPWACATYGLPVRLGGYEEGDGALGVIQQHGAWNCLADVTLETDLPLYPVRRGPDTIYPVGRFRCVLPGPELTTARHLSTLCRVHRVAWYTLAPALRDYAAAVYEARCRAEADGNADLAACLKALLVALPGKLAQTAWHWQTVPNLPAPGPYATWWQPNRDGELVRHRSMSWTVQRCVLAGLAPDAVPAVACWINSAVRVRLLEEIERAGWEHVHYYDTDGLIVDAEGYRRLGSPRQGRRGALGELTLRGVYDDLTIHGIKHYRTPERIVCAGLPAGAAASTADGECYWREVSPTEQIRRRDRPEALRELHPFERGLTYRHGVVGPDGRVSPIRLEEPL